MATVPSNSVMFIPPPTGGINAKDPWYNMGGEYCISSTNIKPDYSYSPVRRGYLNLNGPTVCAYGTQTSATNFRYTDYDGTGRDLMTIYNGGGTGQLYEVSTSGGYTLRGASSYLANMCQFKNIMFVSGGGVVSKTFVPGTLANINWTDVAATANFSNTLASPWTYKGRLYFTQNSSSDIYYGAIDQVTAAVALNKFPVGKEITTGGTPLFGGHTQLQDGLVDKDFWVLVTSTGEVLVYQGADPAASDWQIVGKFKIAPAVHAGSFFYYGSNLHIITTQGIIAMSDILAGNKDGASYVSISRNIEPELSASFASAFGVAGYLDIARAAISATENLLYVSALDHTGRYTGSAGTRIFYVMNLSTKAWGVYSGPINHGILCNPVSDNNSVRFGTIAFTDMNLWVSGQGNRDLYNNVTYSNIYWKIRTAFLSDKKMFTKKFNKVKSIIEGTDYYDVTSYVDFEPTTTSSGTFSQANTVFIKKAIDINQLGTFISLYFSSYIKSTATSSQLCAFYGAFISYEPGSNIP